MKRKRGLQCMAIFLTVLQFPLTAWAAEEQWYIGGAGRIQKANESVNINPWNVAAITGGGESGKIDLVTEDGTVSISLDKPLYRLSEAYTDRITKKDGLWGIERNVSVIVFDGSENWSRYTQPAYQNSNTVIFSCTVPEAYSIQNGISTHFDFFLDEDQKNNRFDGISFGREYGSILVRFMKVRGIATTEALKTYLKGQYDSGRAVKLFYPSAVPVFTPFDKDVQEKLEKSDVIGFRDAGLSQGVRDEKAVLPYQFFKNKTSGDGYMNSFLSALTGVSIQYAEEEKNFYVEGLYPERDGLKIVGMDGRGNSYSGTLSYQETNFLRTKPAEVILKRSEGNGAVIKLKLNLSKVRVPQKTVNGFTAEETAFREDCVKTAEFVLPAYIPVTKEVPVPFYVENAVMYGGSYGGITVEGGSIVNNNVFIDGENDMEIAVKMNGQEHKIELIFTEEKTDAQRNIIFVGDSLINQDVYTEAVASFFRDDSTKLSFLGTRGKEGSRHEGRGGWSAYDYCNEENKYGFANPFLRNGKFDFRYYMESNHYDRVDMVLLNLGINDLNLEGHNSHEEILGYFNTIIDSIHSYDPNIKILINQPAVPYEKEETNTSKNERLAFIKSLTEAYGTEEEKGIFLVPVYLSVNPLAGFKFEEPVIDEFNQDYALTVTDTTHPDRSGYEDMARMTYQYIKYAEAFEKQ